MRIVAVYVPINMWADLLLSPGKTIDYDGHRITYPDIAAVVWAGGNPFAHAQDVNRVIRAWQRPEVTIVADFNWTATAKHADIVLPATTPLERNDIVATDEYIVASQQIVKPMNEARNDFDIFGGIATRLGHGPAFSEGRDEMAWLRAFYAQAKKSAPALPDFDTFWKRGFLHFPASASAGQVVAYADFRTDPDANPLSTPSGKIELFPQRSPGSNIAIRPVRPRGSNPPSGSAVRRRNASRSTFCRVTRHNGCIRNWMRPRCAPRMRSVSANPFG